MLHETIITHDNYKQYTKEQFTRKYGPNIKKNKSKESYLTIKSYNTKPMRWLRGQAIPTTWGYLESTWEEQTNSWKLSFDPHMGMPMNPPTYPKQMQIDK